MKTTALSSRFQWLLMVSLVLISCGAWLFYQFGQAHELKVASKELEAIADSKLRQVVWWRDDRLREGKFFSRAAFVSGDVSRFFGRPEDPQAREQILSWMKLLQADGRYARVTLFDTNRLARLSLPDSVPLPGSALKADLAAALAASDCLMSDVRREEPSNEAYIDFLVPVFPPGADRQDRRPMAVLELRVDPLHSLYPLMKSWPARSGETLLLRCDQDQVRFLSPLRFSTNAPLELSLPLRQTNLPAAIVLRNGQKEAVEGIDYRGVPVLAALRRVPDSPWWLEIKMDEADVMDPLRVNGAAIAVGALMLGLLAMAGLGWFWRKREAGFLRFELDAQAAVRQREQLFSTIFHASPAAIGISRLRDGRFIDVNEAFLRLYGYTREEIIGHTSDERQLWPSEERALVLSKLHKGETVRMYDIRGRRKSGEICDLLASMELIESAGEPCILGILSDWTDRIRAQRELATSRAELAAIHDSSPLMACLVDRSFQVVQMNRTMTEFLGTPMAPDTGVRTVGLPGGAVPVGDLRGGSLGELLKNSPLRQAILRTFETGQSLRQFESALSLVHGDVRREFQVLASTSRVELGEATRVLLCLEDITQRRRLESQFLQAQKMESIGQLAGGVAHDFNNILAATMMQLSMLRQNKNLDKDTQETLGEMMVEARRAANLTRQLLLFSRRSVMETKPLNLNELIADLLKMLGRLIGEHIGLRFDRYERLPMVEADQSMVEQVLMNLSVNARDAMPKGGWITISVRPFEADEERVGGRSEVQPGLFVCLSVSDTGCGIDEANLKRIFEPFFTTKEPGKGTGLGLATVYGIAAQHKGWVEVESELGKGSRFSVFFPARAEMTTTSVPTKEDTTLRGHETILLVEDEEGLRRGVKQALRLLGYRVLEAANGEEALKLWQEHGEDVDLLCSDMVMPGGLTGLDLAEKLRKQRPSLKVIVSSGYNTENDWQTRVAETGILYLQKPYDLPALSRAIRSCLDRP